MANSGILDPLRLLNDGLPVKFLFMEVDVLEVDGLLLNHEAVVINEVKNSLYHSPSLEQVQSLQCRGTTLLGLLYCIAATSDDYETEPEDVKKELVQWLTETQKPYDVALVMSGYDFSPAGEGLCRDSSIHVVRVGGST